jgi:hypothetical protein
MANPPPDSAIARAIAFGINPTITFYNTYGFTPDERREPTGRTIRMAAAIALERERRERSS